MVGRIEEGKEDGPCRQLPNSQVVAKEGLLGRLKGGNT